MDTSWYQTIDIPLVMFDAEMLKAFIESVRYSMRSVGTVGLIGFGVIVSACFAVKFFNEHFFRKERIFKTTENRELDREVDKPGFNRNPNTILGGRPPRREFAQERLVNRRTAQGNSNEEARARNIARNERYYNKRRKKG